MGQTSPSNIFPLSTTVINGCKLIVLSSKTRHSLYTRFGFFLGGFTLASVSVLTLFVSAIYNNAIATSNTGLITNAVIILFITDLDELVHDIVMTVGPDWAALEEEGSENNNRVAAMEEKVRQVEIKNSVLESKILEMEEELSDHKGEMKNIFGKIETIQSTMVLKEALVLDVIG